MIDQSMLAAVPGRGVPSGANWLRQFEARYAVQSPAYDRRRRQMLALASLFITVSALGWAAHHFIAGEQELLLLQLVIAALGAVTWPLVRLQLPRTAVYYFCTVAVLMVVAQAVVLDVPTPAVPRLIQLYLLPLVICCWFLLMHDNRHARFAFAGVILMAFVALTGSLASFGFQPRLPDEVRSSGAWVIAALTSVAIVMSLRVILNELRENSALALDFARGITSSQIELFLQPQCSRDGEICGAEALMRWRHPKRGYVSPAEFIPMAERTELIIPAGEQLTRMVCDLLETWKSDPVLGALTVSVNVSGVQLYSPVAAQRLMDVVDGHGAKQQSLKFELTESMLVSDFEAIRQRMATLRAMGVRLALDDFGTGFSSLSYLRQLPLDQLKVDQSFVRELPADETSRTLARGIIRLGMELGLEVVAEGTENPQQVQCLNEMGCQIFQGFYFSKPVPVTEFVRLVGAGPLPAAPT